MCKNSFDLYANERKRNKHWKRLFASIAVNLSIFSTVLAQTPEPTASLSAPSNALVGEAFSFKVNFSNTGGPGDVGFGPFVDIAVNFNGIDNNASSGPCDGITFIKAEMVGVNPSPLTLSATPAGNTNPVNCPSTGASHPFTEVGALTFPKGWQIHAVELPFGSFEYDQPAIEIDVTALMHDHADRDAGLEICVRGGFRHGNSATGGTAILQSGHSNTITVNPENWTCEMMKPQVFIARKSFSGRENEMATGPNFVESYEIALDIATGQTVGDNISPLTLTDCLPAGMNYVPNSAQVSVPALGPHTITEPTPGCITVEWQNPVIGAAGIDETVTFDFWIDEFANGSLVLNDQCDHRQFVNKLRITGDWTPVDPRDAAEPANTDIPAAHTLTAKCLPIQKSVSIEEDKGHAGYTPGDILTYTLDFQVSDYRTIGKLLVEDVLSNGHEFLANQPPLLTFSDRVDSYSMSIIPDVSTVPSTSDSCTSGPATQLRFDVSQTLAKNSAPRHLNGIITGGHAASPNAAVPAKGTITFQARIKDQYDGIAKRKSYVDKHDPLCNATTVKGSVYKNEANLNNIPTATSAIASDDSGTSIAIVGGTFKKSVYTVIRDGKEFCAPFSLISDPCVEGQEVFPGDLVTYRLEYRDIPSGDVQGMTITDWLPQPIFNIGALTTIFGTTCSAAPPALNQIKCGPDHSSALPTPVITKNNATNSFKLKFPVFWDTNNQPHTLDVLFTVRVLNKPYADGLLHTNEAQEKEKATFVSGQQVAISQVNLRQPKLSIRKGVIATNSRTGQFSQSSNDPRLAQAPAGATFSMAGVSGTVTNTTLGNLFNSDLSYIDAYDNATFAIVVENTGGYPAYDVILNDKGLRDCFAIRRNTLKIRDGAGNTVAATINNAGPGGFKITLTDPIPALTPTTQTTGDNIVIITFRVRMSDELMTGCCTNSTAIKNYASKPGGPNFVAAGLGDPLEGSAKLCSGPKGIQKCVRATSEGHTKPDSSKSLSPDVAIGEIVRYRLMISIPEGIVNGLQITDQLPTGMSFIPGTVKAAFLADNNIKNNMGVPTEPLKKAQCHGKFAPDHPIKAIDDGVANIADFFTFDLTNNDNDPGQEYIIIDLNARVNNQPSNQKDKTLANSYHFSYRDAYGSKALEWASPNTNITVVEPEITVTKTPDKTAINKASTVAYSVDLENTGTSTAFELRFTDTLPAPFTSIAFLPGGVPPGCTSSISGQMLNVKCNNPLAVGEKLTVKYAGAVARCTSDITNTAEVTWSSLPGIMGTVNNQTGSSITSPSGAADGERNGLTTSVAGNDHKASDTDTLACKMNYMRIEKIFDDKTGGTPLPSEYRNKGFPIKLKCSNSLGKTLSVPIKPGFFSTNNSEMTQADPSRSMTGAQPSSGPSRQGTTCTVTEDTLKPIASKRCRGGKAEWTTTFSPANGKVSFSSSGGTKEVIVTNTLECPRSYLRINKEFIDKTGGTELPAQYRRQGFPIKLNCDSRLPVKLPVSIKPGFFSTNNPDMTQADPDHSMTGSKPSSKLSVPGKRCTVTEDRLEPILTASCPDTTGHGLGKAIWKQDISPNNGRVTIPTRGTAEVTVTNTLQCERPKPVPAPLPILDIEKSVDLGSCKDNPAGLTTCDFDFKITNLSGLDYDGDLFIFDIMNSSIREQEPIVVQKPKSFPLQDFNCYVWDAIEADTIADLTDGDISNVDNEVYCRSKRMVLSQNDSLELRLPIQFDSKKLSGSDSNVRNCVGLLYDGMIVQGKPAELYPPEGEERKDIEEEDAAREAPSHCIDVNLSTQQNAPRGWVLEKELASSPDCIYRIICDFKLTITNDTGSNFSGPIVIHDNWREPNGEHVGGLANAGYTASSGWTCSDPNTQPAKADPSISCSHPGITIINGGSETILLSIHAGASDQSNNCISLASPTNVSVNDDEACLFSAQKTLDDNAASNHNSNIVNDIWPISGSKKTHKIYLPGEPSPTDNEAGKLNQGQLDHLHHLGTPNPNEE